jgi:hypothetical protein
VFTTAHHSFTVFTTAHHSFTVFTTAHHSFSRGLNAMKSSRAIIRVRVELISNVSQNLSLMMEAETVSETLDTNSILTRLITGEDFWKIVVLYTYFNNYAFIETGRQKILY